LHTLEQFRIPAGVWVAFYSCRTIAAFVIVGAYPFGTVTTVLFFSAFREYDLGAVVVIAA
jgi:hypothetical protein